MVYTLADGTQMTRRKRIPFTGAASGAQTDFQIKMAAIAYAAAMQPDFGCLRFVKADMQTLIDAWLEAKSDGSSADVWGEFPTTPANGVTENYWMYYGNVGAASDWDGAATFPELFDDFEGEVGLWDKYESNPILDNYTGGVRFDDGYVYRSMGIIEHNSEYYMYYTGGHAAAVPQRDNIGLAISSDLINWTRYNGDQSEDAIVYSGSSGDFDYDRAWGAPVIKESDTSWKMWYLGDSSISGHVSRMGYATSTDGKAWTKYNGSGYGNCIFEDMGGASSGNRGVFAVAILKESATDYKMIYSRMLGSTWCIKYATSSNGIDWTIQNSGNPVISSPAMYVSQLKKIDSTYYLWTFPTNLDHIEVWTSSDLISWTKHDDELDSTAATWDADVVCWGHVFEKTSGNWYMFYSGRDTEETNTKIGYATMGATLPISDSAVSGWTIEFGATFIAVSDPVKIGDYAAKKTATGSFEAYKTFSSIDERIFEFYARVTQTTYSEYILIEKTGSDSANSVVFRISGGNIQYLDGTYHTLQTHNINQWYKFKVTTHASSSTFDVEIDGVNKGTGLSANGDISAGLTAFSVLAGASATLYVDGVFMHKFATSPPTHTFGTEEHQRRTPQFM